MSSRITPLVNINGTSREELIQQRIDIADACNDLLEAISPGAD